MKGKSLKFQATRGVLWSALDKISVQAGHFIIGIILARLLMPEDFGLIGMLSIFIAISQVFIDSGMGSGLVQKQDRKDIDYSTVFVFNLNVSIILYGLLFFLAPFIARFYEIPQLSVLTRILSVNLIINSLAIVQRSKLTIEIDFKTLAKVNVGSLLLSGLPAIYLAYNEWGVWALVAQNLLRAVISTVLLWLMSRWKPSLAFSVDAFKRLFGFGSKLLAAGLYALSFREIYNITIGKVYSAADLGYFTRAKGFAELTSGTITSILYQVTYPILASLQNDRTRLISVYSQLLRMTAFIVFPTMTLLALMAEPVILLLLTEKWAPVIVLLQWFCFARIFYPLSVINMNILNAIGRSDLFLKVDLLKAPLVIISLLITIPLGVKAMTVGMAVVSVMAFFVNAYMPGRLFNYGGFKQLKNMFPILVATALMAICVYACTNFIESHVIKLAIGLSIGFISYSSFVYILKVQELKEVSALFLFLKNRKQF